MTALPQRAQFMVALPSAAGAALSRQFHPSRRFPIANVTFRFNAEQGAFSCSSATQQTAALAPVQNTAQIADAAFGFGAREAAACVHMRATPGALGVSSPTARPVSANAD